MSDNLPSVPRETHPMPRKGGRKNKCTPAVRQLIVSAILNGSYFAVACRFAGIDEDTGREWMQRGEGRHPKRGTAPEYVEFAQAVRKAEADLEVLLLADHHTYLKESRDPKEVMRFMEKRFRDRWGQDAPKDKGIVQPVVIREIIVHTTDGAERIGRGRVEEIAKGEQVEPTSVVILDEEVH